MRRTDIKEFRRQQLIEATIASIAKRGFAETTLADVAGGAGLSHGIVNFYFKSKEALLVATLKHLAEEYEVFWRSAVARAGPSPAAKLDAIIEADFHPAIANRKKIAVWFAFWGEARSRPEYLRLCNKLEAAYFEQTHSLCRRIIDQGGHGELDATRIARGLNAMVNGLWLDLLINPRDFNRETAKQTCRLFLVSVFPAEFADRERSAA